MIDVDRDHDVEQGRRQKELRNRQPKRKQDHRHTGRGDHEQGVEDVVRRDDARLMALLAAGLNQGVERDDIEASEQPEQRNVGQQLPMHRLAQKSGKVVDRAAWGQPRARPIEVNAEHGKPDRTERYQPDFHLPCRELLAQQRAKANAEREDGQQKDEHAFVAVQDFLGEGRELRAKRRLF